MFEGKQSWSLFKLFGTSLKQECPLSSSTEIIVETSSNTSSNPHQLSPEPTRVVEEKSTTGSIRTFAVYDVEDTLAALVESGHKNKHLNIGSQYKKDHIYWLLQSPPLTVTRSISGYGVSGGRIISRISNTLDKDLKILYMDVIPWYLRLYIHTLKITAGGNSLEPGLFFYRPAKDRIESHHIEFSLVLPASSVTEIRIDFDRSYLKWTEYPPDANHGVYAGSAIITSIIDRNHNFTLIPGETTSGFVRIHSECLLISLPTPDFSMPYNVICLVSTVISLAFGPIHKLTTMRAGVPINKPEGSSLFSKLMSKLKRRKVDEDNTPDKTVTNNGDQKNSE